MPIIVENHVIVGYEKSDEKEVFIPEDIIDIGTAFREKENLENIHVSEKNPYYTSVDGVVYDKQVKRLICCPAGKYEVTIPESVEIIEENAFSDSEPEPGIMYTLRLNFTVKKRKLSVTMFWGWGELGSSVLEFIKYPDIIHFIGLSTLYQPYVAAVCWDFDERIRDFLKDEEMLSFAVHEIIREQDAAGLKHLLKSGLITKENIDSMIEYAIKTAQWTKNTECQVLLMDYKYQQGFFEDSEEIIQKKFEL